MLPSVPVVDHCQSAGEHTLIFCRLIPRVTGCNAPWDMHLLEGLW